MQPVLVRITYRSKCKTTHLESIQTSVEFLSKLHLTDTGHRVLLLCLINQ